MGIEQFPPVRTIMGLVHDRHSLPARAEAGEAYYDASSGHLWVWDAAHEDEVFAGVVAAREEVFW